MKYFYLILLVFLCVIPINAQIGINTNTPTADLEVVGDVKTDGSLFLENPGDNTQIRGSKLLIRSTGGDILKYDINASKYGPINYVEFAFRNISTDGLQDYDTKISTTDYFVSVQGYSFQDAQTGDADVMVHSLVSADNIEGYRIYAYADAVTLTWHIKAFANNSQFQTRQGNVYVNTEVDILMNIMIYRKGFISKAQIAIPVDMGDVDTGTAPLPPGF